MLIINPLKLALLTLALLVLNLNQKTSSKQCFDLYASIVGGGVNDNGNTIFTMIFPLPDGFFIVMGYSSSTFVLDKYGASGRPFIIKYNPQLQIQYARQVYRPSSTRIYKVAWGSLSQDGQYLFVTTEYGYAAMLLFRVSDGELLTNFMVSKFDNQIYASYVFQRAEMQSLDKVYIFAFDQSTYHQVVFQLDLSGISNGIGLTYPIIPVQAIESQGAYEWFQIMYLSQNTRFLYLFGRQYTHQAVFKLDTQNSLQSYSNFGVNFPPATQNSAGVIEYASIVEDQLTNIQWQFLCSYYVNYNTSSGQGDLNFWLLKEINKDQPNSQFSYEKSYYVGQANQFLYCAGAYLDKSLTKFAGALYSYYQPYFSLIVAFEITDTVDNGLQSAQQNYTTLGWVQKSYDLIKLNILQQNLKSGIQIDPLQNFTKSITPSSIKNYTYTIGSPLLVIKFNDFNFSEDCSDSQFTYTLFINSSATLPGFIQIDSSSQTIYVISTNNSFEGNHSAIVQGSLPDGFQNSTTFNLEIFKQVFVTHSAFDSKIILKNAGPPFFMQKPRDIIITAGSTSKILLPTYIDPDPLDLISLKVNLLNSNKNINTSTILLMDLKLLSSEFVKHISFEIDVNNVQHFTHESKFDTTLMFRKNKLQVTLKNHTLKDKIQTLASFFSLSLAHLPLFSIDLPANMYYFFSLTIGSLKFDMFQVDDLFSQLLGIVPTQNQYAQNFQDFDYGTTETIFSIGPTAIFIALVPTMLLVMLLLKSFAQKINLSEDLKVKDF
eukprot:403359197